MPTHNLTLNPVFSDAEFEKFISQFTSYETLLSYHYGHETMKIERMNALAADLGNPHLATRGIHVAGTKGKGSTCLILEALLLASGNDVGAYLSPHVEFLRERIRFGGQPIAEHELCSLLNSTLPVLDRRRAGVEAASGAQYFPTFFELMTALAMLHFKHKSVGYALYEVGLGGRLDATNIVRPMLTAITSIGMEHTDKLGDSLASIATEKAGIIKPGVPCIVGPSIADEARQVIAARAAECNAPLVEVSRDKVQCDQDTDMSQLLVEPHGWRLPCGPLHGPGLREDLAIALTLWEHIILVQDVEPREEIALAAMQALGQRRLPGRVEMFDGDPCVILDGAHTEESVASLRQAIEELGVARPRSLVISVASDKRADAILETLNDIADEIYFTRCDAVRSLDPNDLKSRFEQHAYLADQRLHVIEDPVEAFRAACGHGMPVVVTGSFFLAGAIRQHLRDRGEFINS
jgi:dihydrofolate synthase/folylpolyglutamate synthase